ncbi:PRTRC system ThiF family protein [Bacteroides sp. 51]|uniref:PRTRC system ThiF family protein n=1 Tax=Bacteroides sp. 51 TaxID=2302938 RepID=UPI0013D40572|nr:PRTRC system ThiF family protein [Bacteroides sp. 51]NDV81355.1 PRTRC system ThiF family protein [Bacteroides sp. 51]
MKKIHFAHPYMINPTHQLTVNLIGVGGTGSQVLSALGRIDHALYKLGHPGIQVQAHDPDIVTEANIGRQLFCESDLGLNKAVVLITRINQFYGVNWLASPEEFSNEDGSANITISCVDSVKSRLDIEKQLQKAKRGMDHSNLHYWLDFGNTTSSGQVVLGTPLDIKQPDSKKFETVSKLPLVTEMFNLKKVKEKDSGPSCSLAEALRKQDLFINSSLAQLGCALLWKLLSTGSVDYRGLYLNLETMNVNPIKL